MECEVDNIKQISVKDVLIEQVKEQSEFCDFTVKAENWEKRFHRSILVVSPFFEKMFKHDFEEKIKGMTSIPVGTPDTVESALMFLYGVKPEISLENAKHFAELADFLLLPSLKAEVITWLEKIDITDDICCKLLKICTDFDINLPRLSRYMESHLPSLFLQQDAVSLSEESVRYILSEPMLSYVQTDDVVRFLLKWVKYDLYNRRLCVDSIKKYIDSNEISESAFQEHKSDLVNLGLVDVQNMTGTKKHRDVILFLPGSVCRHCVWGFEPSTAKWYQLNIESLKQYKTQHATDILFLVEDSFSAKLYFLKLQPVHEVDQLDLINDTVKTYKLITCSKNLTEAETFRNLTFYGHHIFASVKGSVMLNAVPRIAYDDNVPYFMQPSMPVDISQDLLVSINYETVYKGVFGQENIMLSPLFSLKNSQVVKMCFSDAFAVLMRLEMKEDGEKDCIIYDLTDHSLETLNIGFQYGDELSPTQDGFMVSNHKRVIFLCRLSGPSLSSKFHMHHLELQPCTWPNFERYRFNGCVVVREHISNSKYEMSLYEKLVSAKSFDAIQWTQLVIPAKVTNCFEDVLDHELIMTRFPTDKLRCDIDCPHCELNHKTEDTSEDESDISDNYSEYWEDDSEYFSEEDEQDVVFM